MAAEKNEDMADNTKGSKKKNTEILDKLGQKIYDQISKGENPYFDLPTRGLSNVTYSEEKRILMMGSGLSRRYFLNVGHVRKFVQTVAMAALSKELIQSDKHTSLRSAFYQVRRTIPGTKIDIVDDQTETNKAIEDLELITDLTREQLHINANKAGAVAGEVVVEDRGDVIDWSKMGSGGWAIPSNVEDLIFKKIDAKFVIYMEKQTIWDRLNEDKAWKKLNCIIIASQGQATRGIRRLLQRLNKEHNLPVYILTDGDIWGVYIYSTIKFGSITLASASDKLALPEAKFMGLTMDDIERYGLKRHLIKFKDVDISRLNQIKNYEWFKKSKQWMEELSKMEKLGAKVELDAFTAKGLSFMTEHYLPEKLKEKNFLD
ncbi:MAG: DNA topoisomerase IV subunit A [Candidatus Parvarchaeota archaeon]|nr:DNA topoisomerase IV subunit A [Candidatus Parvarchaeota archaeon]